MKRVTFYLDYISPFSYLASQALDRLDGVAEIDCRPVLFAGILAHYGTLGPAEIAPMRTFTYRHVQWLAARDGIALKLPPAHPFNPLPLLRLSVALGSERQVIDRLFRYVWADGQSTDDAASFAALCDELGVTDPAALLADPEVKQGVRSHTEEALQAGVFGVPTFLVNREIFWGYDALDFLVDYLRDPGLLETPGMRAAVTLPVGQARVAFADPQLKR